MKKLIPAFICLFLAVPSQAGTIYVDANATGANNGSSWANAYNYLQDGLTAAVANDEVWVAQGIYTPDSNSAVPGGTGDRAATFRLKNNVALYGGFPAGGGTWQQRDPNTYKTILSGDLAGDDATVSDPCDLLTEPTRADNSYHVVIAIDWTYSTAILDGFSITAGNANGSSLRSYGGGMYNEKSRPTITNCAFSENSAGAGGGIASNGMYNKDIRPTITNCAFSGNSANSGGGMANFAFSAPAVTNCTFTGNSAYYRGGAMHNHESYPTITNCAFSGNSANWDGGAMYNGEVSEPTITNCTFSGNSANNGGGVHNFFCFNPTLTNCTFTGNLAYSAGGGMYNEDSSPTLTNCTFRGNSAVENGGGGMANFNPPSNPKLTNCTFSNNDANTDGGGMYNYYCDKPTLTNCTFVSNNASNGKAISCDSPLHPEFPCSLKISNSILWDGGNEIWNSDDSTIIITHSDVQDGWPGIGNIDIDPCFVDPANDDYHLKSEGWSWDVVQHRWTYDDVTSRCIDAGNPGSPLASEPITIPDDPNNLRGQNLRVNMGAYGGTAEASMPPYDWAILGDLTNDGLVNLEDYAFQAADWLNSANQQPGDLNRDSLIDMDDLALLVEDWLRQTTWHE